MERNSNLVQLLQPTMIFFGYYYYYYYTTTTTTTTSSSIITITITTTTTRGVGVKYIWGEASRYFFNFNIHDRANCNHYYYNYYYYCYNYFCCCYYCCYYYLGIVADGVRVSKDSCNLGGAIRWGLTGGQMTHGCCCCFCYGGCCCLIVIIIIR